VGQLRQAQATCGLVRSQVCADVKSALAEVQSYRQQIELAVAGLNTADRSYQTNLGRIREGEGIPLELLQAIRARHEAQQGLTQAISNYNRAQFRLLRAIGKAPDESEATAYGEVADQSDADSIEVLSGNVMSGEQEMEIPFLDAAMTDEIIYDSGSLGGAKE
jgi:hypothetical protein